MAAVAARTSIEGVIHGILAKDPNAEENTQDPSRSTSESSFRSIKLTDIRATLAESNKAQFPLNVLDFRPPGIEYTMPHFLYEDGNDMLHEVYDKIKESKSSKGKTKELQETLLEKRPWIWATFAQAGAITTPHQDADGSDTWLFIVKGRLGFLYMEKPTVEQMEEWHNNPTVSPRGCRWTLRVVSAGETVFFPAGTVHAVVRLPGDEHTMTYGGHVLRRERIVRFAELAALQVKNPAITNEDEMWSLSPYLVGVCKIVCQATDVSKYGGQHNIQRFWDILGVRLPLIWHVDHILTSIYS